MSLIHYSTPDTAVRGLCQRLVQDASVPEVGSRLGETTRELLMQQFTIMNPLERELTIRGRRANLAAQIAETAWVLAGRNDVAWLERYLPRAKDFSDDGETWRGGYGPRLRGWRGVVQGDGTAPSGIDQVAHVVNLINSERGTRRAVMSIYDPVTDSEPGRDVPCNNWLSFISREGKLHLHVAARSNDLMWGWSGINQFEWSALLEVVAHLTGNLVGTVTYSITSLHLYDRHWRKAEKLANAPAQGADLYPQRHRFFPEVRTVDYLDSLLDQWFDLEERLRTEHGRYEILFEMGDFPEPMLRSWLMVLGWWWSGGDRRWLLPLQGTRLEAAALAGLQPKPVPEQPQPEQQPRETPFQAFAAKLHEEKNSVYGDSWRRRGERVAIQANVARKVDRLGVAGAGDTSADTAVDLLIYLVKYHHWLGDQPDLADDPQAVADRLAVLAAGTTTTPDFIPSGAIAYLKARFEDLLQLPDHPEAAKAKRDLVWSMAAICYRLAEHLWRQEQLGVQPDLCSSEGASIDAWLREQSAGHALRNRTRRWNPEA